jgi:hypothetical protein
MIDDRQCRSISQTLTDEFADDLIKMTASSASNDPEDDVTVTETDATDTDFHPVDLEGKERGNVVDEVIQKDDAKANIEKVDSLYKEEPLADEKRVILKRRRRLYNVIAVAIGLVLVIILLSTLRKPKQAAKSKKDMSNDDKDTLPNTQNQNTADTSIPKLACANTVTLCPMYSNGTWIKLPKDIFGAMENDYAGFATALSCDGSIVAVSSIYGNNQSGNVRVYQIQYENNEQTWTKLGNDIEGTTSGEEFGYSLTMSSDGYTIAIGSRKSNDKAVRVFTYVDDLWVPLGQNIQGEVAGDQAGGAISLSMDGTRIAIGASSNNGTVAGAGHARVYEITKINGESIWMQLGQDLDGTSLDDQFGRSISLSGDGRRVAVGGHTVDTADGILNAGQVRVFDYDSTTTSWIQVAAPINGQKTDEYFGVAVSLSYDGRRLAIGSPHSDPYSFGVTRLYELSDNGWSQIGSNLFGGGSAIDLSLDGNRVAIGTKGNYANGMESGLLSIYDYDATTSSWSQVGDDIYGNAGDNSATSVAISADGNRVVVSSPSGDNNGTVNSGIVRVYDFC